MKGLIVEIERKGVLVMDKDGKIQRIPKAMNHAVGTEVVIPSKYGARSYIAKKYALMAAALVLTVGLSFYVWADRIVAVKINVDINPSVEVWVNNMGSVIKVIALNADGENLLKEAGYKAGSPIETLRKIISAADQAGYFAGTKAEVVVVSITAGSDKIVRLMKASIDADLDKYITDEGIQAVIYVDRHIDTSINEDVSSGQMLLIEKLIESKPDAVAEDYYDSTIKDIVDEIIIVRHDETVIMPEDSDIDELVDETERMDEHKREEQSDGSDDEESSDSYQTAEPDETHSTITPSNTPTSN